jgi:hypothetical protein
VKTPRVRPLYTEGEMLAMLKRRYTKQGNGGSGEFAFLTHVRDEAGFEATRTIDALAMGLWKSRGFDLHAFEVKCSRSDYLSEIRNPAKAERFGERVDYFWMVVADPTIVRDDLPHGWGLLAASAPTEDAEGRRVLGSLRVVKQAPRQELTREQRLITRSWLVSLLRSAGAVPGERAVEPEEIRTAVDEAWKAARAQGERQQAGLQQRVETLTEQIQREREVRRTFEVHSGISLDGYREHGLGRAERTGDLVRAALRGGEALRQAAHSLERAEADLRRMADTMQQAREGNWGSHLPMRE